jgi:hypothetical protein
MKTAAFWPFWVALLLVLAPDVASAQYPPPKSAQDAACRNYAASRVMSGRRPSGVALETLGRRYWSACMQRAQAKAAKSKRSRRAK